MQDTLRNGGLRMAAHTFQAKLTTPDAPGAWTFVPIPAAVTKALASRARIPVTATVDGVPLQGSLMPDGDGGHFLVVNKAVRTQAGKTTGDTVKVALSKDTTARRVEVPEELATALASFPEAQRAFEAMPYSHQKEHADHVEGAKQAETRARRAQKCVELLLDGATPKRKK